MSSETSFPPHGPATRWVLRMVGADPRDAPGPLAHHHLMAFTFVVVNLVLAIGLTYSGLPQIAPTFTPGARVAMAVFMGLVVFLMDLYVVSVRYRLPEREPTGRLSRAIAFVVARSELLPRLLMTGLLVLGLGALLTFTVNAEEIDKVKEERAASRSDALVEERVASEREDLSTRRTELSAAEATLTDAERDLADRRAEEAAARDLRNCELYRNPPPARTPGCTGQAGTGPAFQRADTDWQDARERTAAAVDALAAATQVRDDRDRAVGDQQAIVEGARAEAEQDPALAPEAVRVDGWSATRSAFAEATAGQSWYEKYWPEIVVFVVDVTPLMLMLFGGRQESQVLRERRLRRRRRQAALDEEIAFEVQALEHEAERDRLRAVAVAARAHLAAEQVRADAAAETARDEADAAKAEERPLRDQRVADAHAEAEHRAALAAQRRSAESDRLAWRLRRERETEAARDDATDTSGPDDTDDTGEASEASDASEAGEAGAPVRPAPTLDRPRDVAEAAPGRPWSLTPLAPTDTAVRRWEPGAEIRFASGTYRLVTKISEAEGEGAYSSSNVWFAEAVGDRLMGAPQHCAVKAMAPGRRFAAEESFLNTVGLQPVGIANHVGIVMHGDLWAVGYEYHPRTDAARYAFGTVDREEITVGVLLEWLAQALEGLRTLWHHGLLHNDVKLLNLLVTGSYGTPPDRSSAAVEPLWKVLIADFDVVCATEDRASVTAQSWELCAPEVFAAGQRGASPLPLSPRTDLYGLFAAIYQVATSGHHPRQSTAADFGRELHADLATDLLTERPTGDATLDPIPLPLPAAALAEGLPRAFSELLQDGVHPHPGLRFRGAGEDYRELYAYAEAAIRACRARLSPAELGFVVAGDGPVAGYPAPAGWPTTLDAEMTA